jgi:hypothetical protein
MQFKVHFSLLLIRTGFPLIIPTPWYRVVLELLMVTHLAKKFLKFVTAFTKPHYLSYPRMVHSHPVGLIYASFMPPCVTCFAVFYPPSFNHPNNIGSRCTWMDNIKMDFREIGRGGMDRIDLTQDRNQWMALMITLWKLRGPYNIGKFLISCTTWRFIKKGSVPRN